MIEYELNRSLAVHQEQALQLLSGWGYEPDKMCDHSLTSEGYLQMRFDADGKRVIEGDSISTFPRPWRSPLHWEALKKHLRPIDGQETE